MKLIGKGGVSRIVEYMVVVLLCLAPLVMVTLPWTIPMITGERPGGALHLFEKYMIILEIAGVLAILVLWQARGVMRNVNRGQAFCADSVRRLRVIAIECLTIGILFGIATFFATKFFMVVVLVTFVTAGMVLLVFAELFRQAVAYKEENDMTI